MGFRFRRSFKLLPGIRLNLGKRGISASIGGRGAHVTIGPTGTRTTVGLPGTGLSYTHLEKSHRAVTSPTVAVPATASPASPGSAGRGFLWIALIGGGFIMVINLTSAPTPVVREASAPLAARAPQAVAPAADLIFAAETTKAILGADQIRHTVPNANTLKYSQVVAMPQGALCYKMQLTNSRGVLYARTAVLDHGMLIVSGSTGFTVLWENRCAQGTSGRDITAAVIHGMSLSPNH